jgi:DUF438 domain-containing protein
MESESAYHEPDETLIAVLREMNKEDNLPPEYDPLKLIEREGINLSSMTPLRLAFAEEELVNRGVELKLIESKLELHIKLLINPVRKLVESLPTAHVLKSLIAEHLHLDYLLDEILHLNALLAQAPCLTATSPEFKKLIHIADHVQASAKHTDFEEEIIFPAVEAIGIKAIPRLLRAEHFEIRHHAVQLHSLAFNCSVRGPVSTARIFDEITSALIPLKKRHVLIEECLIYPIAAEVISEQTWDKLKERCEAIGFCCFEI